MVVVKAGVVEGVEGVDDGSAWVVEGIGVVAPRVVEGIGVVAPGVVKGTCGDDVGSDCVVICERQLPIESVKHVCGMPTGKTVHVCTKPEK